MRDRTFGPIGITGASAASMIGDLLLAWTLTSVGGALLVMWNGWDGRAVGLALVAFALITAAAGVAWAGWLSAPFGWANRVTLWRAGLICLIATPLLGAAVQPGWSLALLITLALALDAVDGWLARRLGLTSAFGARFDIEVDGLFLLILALLVWQAGRAGPWVLPIGLLHYAFMLARRLWPRLRQPLPESRRRRTICGLQGATLLFCLLPPVDPDAARLAAATALGALVISFAIDIRWLLHRGPAAPDIA